MAEPETKPDKKYTRPRMYVTADGFVYAKPEEIINSKEFEIQREAVKRLRKRLSEQNVHLES